MPSFPLTIFGARKVLGEIVLDTEINSLDDYAQGSKNSIVRAITLWPKRGTIVSAPRCVRDDPADPLARRRWACFPSLSGRCSRASLTHLGKSWCRATTIWPAVSHATRSKEVLGADLPRPQSFILTSWPLKPLSSVVTPQNAAL